MSDGVGDQHDRHGSHKRAKVLVAGGLAVAAAGTWVGTALLLAAPHVVHEVISTIANEIVDSSTTSPSGQRPEVDRTVADQVLGLGPLNRWRAILALPDHVPWLGAGLMVLLASALSLSPNRWITLRIVGTTTAMLAVSLLASGGMTIEFALERLGAIAGIANSDHMVASIRTVLSPYLIALTVWGVLLTVLCVLGSNATLRRTGSVSGIVDFAD